MHSLSHISSPIDYFLKMGTEFNNRPLLAFLLLLGPLQKRIQHFLVMNIFALKQNN